jgi:hypothetical protein
MMQLQSTNWFIPDTSSTSHSSFNHQLSRETQTLIEYFLSLNLGSLDIQRHAYLIRVSRVVLAYLFLAQNLLHNQQIEKKFYANQEILLIRIIVSFSWLSLVINEAMD